MYNLVGLFLVSSLALALPAQQLGPSPHDLSGEGSEGTMGRGTIPEEHAAAVSLPAETLVPVFLPAPRTAPVSAPMLTPSRPVPVPTWSSGAAGRTGPTDTSSVSRSARAQGDPVPAQQPALARSNPYVDYDRSWVHGYWNLPPARSSAWPTPGAATSGEPTRGWRGASRSGPRGRGLVTALGAGPGLGLGWGLPAWLIGPMVYRWEYLHYDNPFDEGGGSANPQGQPVYDYSQPVDPTSSPPTEALLHDALLSFEAARAAFRHEDYIRALELADQSLSLLPGDPSIHEFRGLTLLALHRYREAATALHAVIAIVPGWDWATLTNLYDNLDTYTRQLRLLESFSGANPRSAEAHFLLAIQYLSTGYPDAAADQLQQAAALKPDDSVITQLIHELRPRKSGAATTVASGPRESGKLEGAWTARPREDTTITLTMHPRGHLTWRVSEPGQVRQYEGFGLYAAGILTLTQDQGASMSGRITWRDTHHFTFKALEGKPGDSGLSFEKSS